MGRVLIVPGHRRLPAWMAMRMGWTGCCHPIVEQVCAAWRRDLAVIVNHDTGDEDPGR